MKYLLLFLLSFSIISCSNIKKTEYEISDEIAYLKIGTDITKSELTKIAEEFKELKNIDIDFSRSTFDANEKILSISLKVNCNDGNSGSSSASPFKSRIGFTKKYNDSNDNFSIGNVDSKTTSTIINSSGTSSSSY